MSLPSAICIVQIAVVVNCALVAINLLTSPHSLWFFWPLLGWGIGIVAHATSVFGVFGIFGPEWEKRKIREIMEREKDRGM